MQQRYYVESGKKGLDENYESNVGRIRICIAGINSTDLTDRAAYYENSKNDIAERPNEEQNEQRQEDNINVSENIEAKGRDQTISEDIFVNENVNRSHVLPITMGQLNQNQPEIRNSENVMYEFSSVDTSKEMGSIEQNHSSQEVGFRWGEIRGNIFC